MINSDKEEQGYLKQILENSPDGMFTTDTELNICYVNTAFCRMLGFTEDELIGTSITNYLGDLNILATCQAEVAKNGKCNDQETIFIRKDGSVVHISKNVQAIMNEDGSFKEILVTIRDMTQLHTLNKDLSESKIKLEKYNFELEKTLEDLRKAQKQLVEAEKMASLGSLVAGVAHEINTPLGVGVTSISALHEELKALQTQFNDGSLTRSFMNDFCDQSDKLCSITYNNLYRASELIKSFKQVAVDQTMEELREIDLKLYCDEILHSLGPKFKNTSITISNQCEEGINFSTYPGAVYQVLSNLLLNSLVHAFDDPKKGTIAIDAIQSDDSITITYQDDGKGIPAELQTKIFEPFYTTRRGSGGTGLGLSIAYNLVTSSLNGVIEVESNEHHGTRFNIKLPVKNEQIIQNQKFA